MTQKFVSDKNMVAILGPSTSGSVAATSKTFTQAGLVQVSPSATRADLTKGSNQEATQAFFRVVPADDYQGPTDANFMINTLHVKNVVVFDFQEPYSQGLGGQVETTLKAAGVTVERQSVPNTVTDFSSYVTNVPNSADVVFFPTQQPAAAQSFAQQLAEQGKKAIVFGGDGSNGPGVFTAKGSYVSNFAPQITSIAADAPVIAAWKKANPGKAVGSFGPPTYGAVQVLLQAIKTACTKGHGTLKSRAAVISAMKTVKITKGWILGGTFSLVEGQQPRPERHAVLHHADPGRRLVQARQLVAQVVSRTKSGAVRRKPGRPWPFTLAVSPWPPSPSSRSTG